MKRESDLLITSMMIDRIGRQELLLPIDHNSYNFQKTTNTFRSNIYGRDNVLSKKISILEIPQFF